MTAQLKRLPDRQRLPTDEEIAKATAFDAIFGAYLIARGKLQHNESSEDDCDRLCDERDNLIWQIIRTPAPFERHLDNKFEILRTIMGTDWTDGRHRALLESIRSELSDGEDI
jgi:hypothetical protein